MLDVGFIRDNREEVIKNCQNRLAPQAEIDRSIELDDQRKAQLTQIQTLQQRANDLAKQIPMQKDPTQKQQLIAEGKSLREQIAQLENEVKKIEENLKQALMTIPNLTHPEAPVGSTASDNHIVRRWGEPTTFSFPIKDHLTLAESLDLIDMQAGANVTGQKFYFLKNEGALLEIALVQYAIQTLVREGYTPIITPDLAKIDVLEGIGFMPRDPNPETRQVYTISDTDLCLIATAEITLGGMHRDHIFQEAELPKRYVGISHCFRTEAGAPGRDTRGIYRVHQFTKIEMFAYCTPDQSEALHREILAIEEKIFQGLNLPYHVLDTCTGDLGGPAYRKYDLEAWMPGRGELDPKTKLPRGEYGEVTSTSNCTDFQARRLNIRYRSPERKGNRFVHTLNGTAIAVTRAIVAILENNQQTDGSVIIPEVLRPWIGKDKIVVRSK